MLNVFFILFRKADNSNVGINCCDASASQVCSDHQKVFLDFQRYNTYQWILFDAHISAHMHGDFFFCQFLFKLPFHICQNFFKSCCIWKSITNLDPSKEVGHGLRWKIVSQIYRDHQSYGAFLLILRYFFPNGTQHHGGQQDRDGDTIGTGSLVDIFYRKNHFCNVHIWMNQLLPFQLYRCFFLFFVLRYIWGIILGKAVFFFVSVRDFFCIFYPWKIAFRMCKDQVILYQFLEKMHSSCTVCQCMKYFKIDSVFIIADLKQKGFFIRNIQTAAWRLCLLFYNGSQTSVLQIKPEQTFSQNCLKQRIFFHCLIQCALQDFPVNLFF